MSASKLITDSYAKVKQSKEAKYSDKQRPGPSTSGVTKKLSDLEILKQFDLTLEYGPCIGITRLERWERAKQHGMNPPEDVKDILDRHRDDGEYEQSLWKDYQL